MLYTETNVRDNLRNRNGQRVFYLGKGDQFTSGARDFLARERIPILPAEQARPEAFRLLNGGMVAEKPEHMTHLNGDVLVPKTHPRIRFRGKLDTLESWLIWCQSRLPDRKEELGQILSLSREILRCDVLDAPLQDVNLLDLTEEELRKRSHFPQDYYHQPHFMPGAAAGERILQLNLARCAAREAELAAVEAFSDREGNPTRVDILRAMNRINSALYLLMIQEKAKQA